MQIRDDSLLRARNLMLYGTICSYCDIFEYVFFQFIAFIASIVCLVGVYRFAKLTHAPLFALHILMIAVGVFHVMLLIFFPSSFALFFQIFFSVVEFLIFYKIYMLFFALTDVWLFRSTIMLGGILLVQEIAAMLYFGHIFSNRLLLTALADSWQLLANAMSFSHVCLLFFLVVMGFLICTYVVVQIAAFYQIQSARLHSAP
ncbi:MAG: hypothetical protein K2O85_08925 [Helicobacter sp.]|nr:hypothetical protein [Helicobacter sp.]